VACDAHPDYLSTKFAEETGLFTRHVQHHLAHVVSCMAENEVEGPALGAAWDGSGYGDDGTIWGGEFLRVDDRSYQRVARLRAFRLPGGEKAIKEPRRAAIGLLYEIFGDELLTMDDLEPIRAFTSRELALLKEMLKKRINSPVTSSAGRLFDAVASVAGVRQITRFEGQGAMDLEFALDGFQTDESYPARLGEDGQQSAIIVDWEPMTLGVINDIRRGVPAGMVSAKFHNTMAESVVAVARRVGEERVALSGGCFENKYLTERAVRRLRDEGFRPYWHQRVPPNDGGVALGQIVAAARTLRKE
jgi:hydrogenase maturation protein HypF